MSKSKSLEVSFTLDAKKQYDEWVKTNPKIVARIHALIENMSKTPFAGLGKPEALRFDLSGCYSRRINAEHRLVYRIVDDEIQIIACKYHYGK